jgi:hypothetical protein
MKFGTITAFSLLSLLTFASVPLPSSSSRSLDSSAKLGARLPRFDKVKLPTVPKPGEMTYTYRLETTVSGTDVELTSELLRVVKAGENEITQITGTFKNTKLMVGGNDQEAPVSELKVELANATGIPKKVEGGIEGADPVRTYLLLQFLAPTAEIAEGDSYTVDVPANKDAGLPAYKFVGKFEGKADLKGKPVFKFSSTFKEDGRDGVTSTNTYLISEDGVVQDIVAKFKLLPVPQIGSTIDGSLHVVAK